MIQKFQICLASEIGAANRRIARHDQLCRPYRTRRSPYTACAGCAYRIDSMRVLSMAVITVSIPLHSGDCPPELTRGCEKDGSAGGVQQDRVQMFVHSDATRRMLETARSTCDVKNPSTVSYQVHGIYAIGSLRQLQNKELPSAKLRTPAPTDSVK
jgi:hypothetical protein